MGCKLLRRWVASYQGQVNFLLEFNFNTYICQQVLRMLMNNGMLVSIRDCDIVSLFPVLNMDI